MQDEAKRNVGQSTGSKPRSAPKIEPVGSPVIASLNLNIDKDKLPGSPKKSPAMGNGIIQEDPNDDEASEGENNEVQSFVKKGIV